MQCQQRKEKKKQKWALIFILYQTVVVEGKRGITRNGFPNLLQTENSKATHYLQDDIEKYFIVN